MSHNHPIAMNQVLALMALTGALLLSVSLRQTITSDELLDMRGEAELAAVYLGAQVLDRMEGLPLSRSFGQPPTPSPTPGDTLSAPSGPLLMLAGESIPGVPASPDSSIEGVHFIDDADGATQTYEVPLGVHLSVFTVMAESTPVVKDNGTFVPTAQPSSFRLVRLRITGPLDVAVSVERLFSSTISS